MRTGGALIGAVLAIEEGPRSDGGRIGMPVKVRAERTDWADGPLAAVESHALTIGLGAQADEHEIRRFSNMFGVTVEHARFEQRIASAAKVGVLAPADAFRKVFVGFDGDTVLLFRDKKERLLASIQARIGWSWLESDRTDKTIRDNALDVRVGVHGKIGKPNELFTLGLGYGRDPNRSADGRRLIADWRLELRSALELERAEIRVHGALSFVESLAGAVAGEEVPTIHRYATHLEALYKLPRRFQVGGYAVASFEPFGALDAWASERSWSREVGLMLRWTPRSASAATE